MALKQYLSLVKNYSRFLAFGALHSFYSGVGQTYMVALFVPFMRERFGASVAEFGIYYSLATLGSAFALPIVGGWIDRINLRLYSAGVGLLAMTACLVTAYAPSMPIEFAGITWQPMAILGLFLLRLSGQGLMSHVCATSIGRYFGRNRGKASSLSDLGHSLGEGILPPIMVMLIAAYGWQGAYTFLGLSCVLLFLPASFGLLRKTDDFQHPGRTDGEPSEAEQAREEHWTQRELLQSPYFYGVIPLASMGAFALTGLIFLQVAISTSKGWGEYWLAGTFFMYPVSVIISGLIVGPFVDAIGARRLFPLQVVPLALAIFVLGMTDHAWIAPMFWMCAGISVGMSKIITGAMWAEVYGTRHLGAIRSVASTVMVFSTALSPALFGALLESGIATNTLLFGLAGFVAFTIVPVLVMPLPRKKTRAV